MMRRSAWLFGIWSSFVPWSQSGYVAGELPSSMPIRLGNADCSQGETYVARIAQNDADRRKGLGGRRNPLAADEAMLFVFDTSAPRVFWMKDVWVSLSVFFFDASGSLVSGAEMKAEADPVNPKAKYVETQPVLTVVETRAGDYTRNEGKPKTLCVKKKSLWW